MAQSRASTLIPAVLAMIVLATIAYILLTDFEPARTEHTVHPPIDVVEPDIEEVIQTVNPVPMPDQTALMDEEAQTFVTQLAPEKTETTPAVIVDEGHGQFVRHDSLIDIPKLEYRETTLGDLKGDLSLDEGTTIVLEFTETLTSTTTLAALDEAIEDKLAPITIGLNDGRQLTAPLADLLNDPSLDHHASITLIEHHTRVEKVAKSALSALTLDDSQTVSATIEHGKQTVNIKDIVEAGDLPDDALFYLHRVTDKDVQGLWGIIQTGLIHRFRQGLSLEGIAQNSAFVSVTIPADADEPLPTGLSSFLGKVLNNKVETSYVYNFHTESMGRDPNLIKPGQQLILIHFDNEELKQIYLFFAEQRNQNAQTFAIN
jgi:hypothetical protein